jgi:starch phosphorylase
LDYWTALSHAMVELMADDWEETRDVYDTVRQTHYFSAEFLVGRSMLNNLVNLGIYEEAKEAVAAYGINLTDLLEQENDPGLGNGGLGRLAACFLDSCATMNLPVTGYGILYRYGLFKQQITNGFQKEIPASWMESGYPFVVRREEERVKVHYNDIDVWAVPYDMPGYRIRHQKRQPPPAVEAEPAQEFDFNLFNSQRFDDAVMERNRVNDIWRVLYPNDTSYDGKVLRVRQQYFFVSASLNDIVRRYKAIHGEDLSQFAEYNSVQINDTHPAIGIPELMRILVDENGVEWTKAWKIVHDTYAYTNHTVMQEALEKWDIGIFQYLFPRIYQSSTYQPAVRNEAAALKINQDMIDRMSPLGDGKVRMAFLAIYGSRSVNGVAALHTEILKKDTLKDWYRIWPEKFSNKTNGVTPRRWSYLQSRAFRAHHRASRKRSVGYDLERLSDLSKYARTTRLWSASLKSKRIPSSAWRLYLHEEGITIDPDSVFDIQIKRLHEYKRQL